MSEDLYQSALNFVKDGVFRSPREIQNWFCSKKRLEPSQAVFFTCKFILEGVRREEVCIENTGCIRLLKANPPSPKNEFTEMPK